MTGTAHRAPLALAALLCAAAPTDAIELETLQTDGLVLVYREAMQGDIAPHAARCFENAMEFQRRLFDYTPSEPVTVLLNDFSDSGNASATVVPRDLLMLETSPIGVAYETVSSNERLNWLMNHELVHIVASDQTARSDRIARRLFRGKVAPEADNPESILWFWLTTPRDAAPRWYHEGLAVFLETWMAGGIGRAQGPWDEMVFRSMVRDGTRFQDPLSLVAEGTKIDFQVEVNSYLYGTRFLSWLAWRFSPARVVEWATRSDGTSAYYASRFRQVFGMRLPDAWQEWIAWEREFQQANLEAIRKHPLTEVTDLSPRALGSVSRAFWDAERRVVYAAVNYPGVVAHVAAIAADDGSVRHIIDVKGPILFTVTSLAWDPTRRKLFYTTDNREWRDVREVDPDTGESRTLLEDVRIGDLVFDRSDGALWGVRHFDGIASIVRIPAPYTEWKLVHAWPYGEVPYDLDVSPDGTLLSASVAKVNGHHTLRVFRTADLLAGRAEAATDVVEVPAADRVGPELESEAPTLPEQEFAGRPQDVPEQPAGLAHVDELDFGAALPLTFTFSPDGRFLYGTTYYTGVANVFRYDLAARSWEAVSNTDGGFFRPLAMDGDRVLVFRYTGEGFVPATIAARHVEDVEPITFLGASIADRHPVVREWKVGSPAAIDLDRRVRAREPYGALGRIRVESVYPIVQGYKDEWAGGVRLNLSDPLMLHRIQLTAAYSPQPDPLSAVAPPAPEDDDERLHLDLRWRRWDWRAFASWNRADFYDLFGPTKTSRKGYGLGLGHDRVLIDDRPRTLRLTADAALHGDLEVLPEYQNVQAPFRRLISAQVRLDYANLRSSLGHVDDEKGFRWYLRGTADRGTPEPLDGLDTGALDGTAPTALGGWDMGFALPWGHSSVWLRTAAGAAWGDRANPLASFYFGGFGNNWVDHRDIKRYREPESFPGLEINEVPARTFGRAMLEWNLPPLRFRHLGTPGFYASWARTSVFATALDADPGGEFGNLGVQVDVRLTVLSRLDLTVSAGWAVAVQRGTFPSRDEAMLSLKILE